ncbi:hypothetical protein FOL47_001111 [Perkinsus chesapeaki]|uniref:Major facilitator superfamily (MFS) profile domain-containing protein n=1 Tax=Perkinsus chesapeaki TaxID=330153 RepID=A0A7J6KV42_PERCH|nr:hypothetical protein FOL47_001111 [Perkinsus chesapeaki]
MSPMSANSHDLEEAATKSQSTVSAEEETHQQPNKVEEDFSDDDEEVKGGNVFARAGHATSRKLKQWWASFKKDPRFLLDLVIVYVSVIVDFMGYTMLSPVFQQVVRTLGNGGLGDSLGASMLMTFYAIGQFITALIYGPLSDRYGRRIVFVIGYTFACIFYILLACAWDYWSYAIFRLCGGLATGTRPVVFSYLGDIATPEQMPFYSAFVSIMIAIGAVMPMIGGSLGGIWWRAPACFGAAWCGLWAVICILWLRNPKKNDSVGGAVVDAEGKVSYPIMHTFLFIVVLAMITYTGFCTQYTNMSIITIFPWLLENKFLMTEADAGLIMGSQAIPTFLSLVVLFMPLSSCDNEVGVIFLSYFLNLGNSLAYASVPVIAKLIAPAPRRGFVNSIVLSATLGAGIFGPLISGPLFNVWLPLPFIVCFCVSATGAICMILCWKLAPVLMKRLEAGSS